MAKNKTAGTIDVKTELLKQALTSFAGKGYEGSSIRQIADAAEVNYQAIVYHFGNKEQLWLQTAQYGFNNLMQSLKFPPGTLEGLDDRQKFEIALRGSIYSALQNSEIYRMLMREAMKQSDRFKKVFDEFISGGSQYIHKMFEEGQKAGIVRNDLPLDYLVSIFFGAAYWRIAAPYESEYETGLSLDDPEVIRVHAETIIKLFTTPA